MIAQNVRFSYCNVFEPAETPSGDLKYSVSILIPADNKATLDAINKAIKDAIAKALDKGTFAKAHVGSLRLPLRNGTEEHKIGKRGPEYDGHFFLNASSKNKPGVVDTNAAPLFSTDDFYSGCKGHVDINFFGYNMAGNKGIGVGLNNLMKKEDADRLDGRMKAEDAFAKFADEEEDDNLK